MPANYFRLIHSRLSALGGHSLLLCLLLLPGLALRSSGENNTMLVTNDLSREGLTIIEYSSPAFQIEIQKLLNAEALSKAAGFLPLSLIVVNNTGKYIWSFTVIYTYPDRIAPAGTPWKHIISPTSSAAYRSEMLAPGTTFLITPVSTFIASHQLSGERPLQPYLDEGMDRMIQLFLEKDSKERIEASVDSIIFEDGTLVGPDTAKRVDKINNQMRGEKELLDSLQGLHGEELRKSLLFYSRSQPYYDDYTREQFNHARHILDFLNEEGEPAALTAIQNRRDRRRFPSPDGVKRREP